MRCRYFILSCQFYGNFNTFKILSTVKNSHWMNLSTFAVLSLWPLKEVSLVVKVCTWITLFNCQISSAKLLLGQSGNSLLWLTIVYRVERGKLKTWNKEAALWTWCQYGLLSRLRHCSFRLERTNQRNHHGFQVHAVTVVLKNKEGNWQEKLGF